MQEIETIWYNNVYDIERYERLREIVAEMVAEKSNISLEKVKDLFCNEKGYQTPKIDTRIYSYLQAIYDNIIFIIPPTTYEEVYKALGEPKQELEKIKEYKNNIFWSYSLKDYRKTNWWAKTASTTISQSITIRTANTMRKVLELCDKV